MTNRAGHTAARRPIVIAWPQVTLVLALVVGLTVLLDFNRRLSETQRIVADAQQLGTEVASLEAEQIALLTEQAYVTSEAYVEQWAHDDGKLVRPGEVLVVPFAPPGATATPPQLPLPPPAGEPTWRLWWALFFGS